MNMTMKVQGFPRLLLALLIYMIVSPFIAGGSVLAIVVHLWLTLVLIFAASAVERGSGRSFAMLWLFSKSIHKV